MGTKNNPGSFDCYARADADEPMFVLLGRDPDAPILVESWARGREAIGEDPEKVAEARACAHRMRAWLASIGKDERSPTNYGPGELQVAHTELGQVVIELPRELTGHMGFSPEQARNFARILEIKADAAEEAVSGA